MGSLLVDSKLLYNEIESYLKQVDPELVQRVKLYEGQATLFDEYDIEHEIRTLFQPRVELPTGGYIIIQPTEAITSIDVNTGRYTGKKDPENTILKTNVEAAREVARQLRLRDIGGIIVVDFIDMESRGNRDKVLNELRTHLGRDRARVLNASTELVRDRNIESENLGELAQNPSPRIFRFGLKLNF